MRWQFKDKAPVSVNVAFVLLFANLVGQFAATYAISSWGLLRADATHSFPIHYRGGPTFFVQPWLGEYSTYGFWLHFVLLGIIFLLFWIYRDQVERVD